MMNEDVFSKNEHKLSKFMGRLFWMAVAIYMIAMIFAIAFGVGWVLDKLIVLIR